MGNFLNLPPTYKADVQIFRFVGTTAARSYQTWTKPRGISMVNMIAIGGGGGGAGGAVGTTSNGGPGGGCSGLTRFMLPAFMLPNVLYIYVGNGGFGGASASAGGAGALSQIITGHVEALPNYILQSGNAAAGGGSVATGGAASTIAVVQPFNDFGLWTSTVGIIGAGSGAGVGTSITCWAAIPLSPGASGGGVNASAASNGGAQTATAITDLGAAGYYTNAAGNVAAGGVSGNIDGKPGIGQFEPFLQSGGAGGRSVVGATGGNGGSGGIGCGGGGGGASTTTGGAGGNGGNGIVIITSW